MFSSTLNFLDIVAQIMRSIYDVTPFRYDGTVKPHFRQKVERDHVVAHPKFLMFITAGAGGVGLNLTAASTVVQLELWWNLKNERQAVCRIHRLGQTYNAKRISG